MEKNLSSEESLEKVLQELHKILDEIYNKNELHTGKVEIPPEFKTKIEEIKTKLKYQLEKTPSVEPEPLPSEETTTPPIPTVEPVEPLHFSKEKVEPEKLPEIQPTLKEDKVISKEEDVIESMFIYPQSVPETETIFYDHLNKSLNRVTKKHFIMKPVDKFQYTHLDELILYLNTILDRIKTYNIKVLFLLLTELTNLDTFIDKVSPYVSVVKLIKFSDLEKESTYIDIAIDILLVIK